jgi:lysine decarboxylase
MAAGGVSGHQAREILLRDFNVHCEIASHATLVLLVGAGASPNVEKISQALLALPDLGTYATEPVTFPIQGEKVMTVRDAYFAKSETVIASQAIGRISADSVAAYPPGIPNLLPGELITSETVNYLQRTAAQPTGHVRGALTSNVSHLRVVSY